MSTSNTTTHQLLDRDQLIEDILKIIIAPWTIESIEHIPGKQITRAMISPAGPDLKDFSKPVVLTWDDKKSFVLYGVKPQTGSVVQMPIASERWYKVGQLLSNRFLAAEKLKKSE